MGTGRVTSEATRGPLLTEELQLEDRTGDGDPTETGRARYLSGAWRFRDSEGVYDPRSGSGLSEAGHEALLQWVHFVEDGIAEGLGTPVTQEISGGTQVFPTLETWKVNNVRRLEITYVWNGVVVSTKTWRLYDTDGVTVLKTMTETFSYSGVFPTGRTRAFS